ncbi:MAG: lysyl oxidase family protein [Actinomycetota bacterium]
MTSRFGAVASLALVLTMAAPSSALTRHDGARGGAPLLPNITTLQPTGLRMDHSNAGARLLRFSNTIANVGEGPIELQPRKEDCNGDGNPANDRTAIQRIYIDADGDGVYRRSVDRAADPRVAGCFEFSVAHGHWHFHDFADYQLVDLTSGLVVASNDKVGFCLSDTLHPYPGVPGSPRHRYYRGCRRNSAQGQSVGFADIYDWYVYGQWIDVTGTPNGDYCLVTTADPANQLLESDETDNAYRQQIRLTASGVVPVADPC